MLAPAVPAHRYADIFGDSKTASLFVTELDRVCVEAGAGLLRQQCGV